MTLTNPVRGGLFECARQGHPIDMTTDRDNRGEAETTTRVLLYSHEPMLAKGLESILHNVEG